MAKNSTKNTIITIVFILAFAAAVFGIYHYVKGVSDKRARDKAEREEKPSEIQEIAALNLDDPYPQTVSTVIRVYCRIIKALHNENPDDSDISRLQFQMRKLFDDELLEQNNVIDQFNALKLEMMEYDDLNRTIEDYKLDQAQNVETWTYEGRSYSRIYVSFDIKENANLGTLYEEFILRKDDAGRWKILGWRRVDKDGVAK